MPESLTRIDRRIPRDLETIVLKCLAKDSRQRYPSADALVEDLRRFLADRPIHARRATVAEQLWRWRRRNPVVAALLATVAALLIFVAVGSAIMAVRFNAQRHRADNARTDAENAERKGRLREAEAILDGEGC